MKTKLQAVILIFIGLMFVSIIHGQKRYTPYDELPGINKSEKPAYNDAYPDWAKMMYEYPVNFNEISEAFE